MIIKPFTDAMKLDIVTILEKDHLGVFEIRRIQNIARAMVDFVNSANTYAEAEAFGEAMRATSDDVAPTLHAALVNRTFDGEAATKELYLSLMEKYSELKTATFDVKHLHKQLTADQRRPQLEANLGLKEAMNRVKQLGAGTDSAGVDAMEDADDEEDEITYRCTRCGIDRRDKDRQCCNRRCEGQWETGCGCCHHHLFWKDEGDTDDTEGKKGTLV